jgi:uncharacterized protein (TIGR02246 family)
MSKFAQILCVAAVSMAVPLTACAQRPAEQSQAGGNDQAQAASDEQAIRETNTRWLDLIVKKDAVGVAALYAENGAFMAPNAPIATGRAAIQAAWQGMMDMPGVALTFEPDEIVVSSSGDMAYDRGTYKFTADGESGPMTDEGKYVVVWRKVDGKWLVAADIFNSSAPAAQ